MSVRLSAGALYRALPHDRQLVESWLRQQLGDAVMNRTLAATPVDGGLDLELIVETDSGGIGLDDRGELLVQHAFHPSGPPPSAWFRAAKRGAQL